MRRVFAAAFGSALAMTAAFLAVGCGSGHVPIPSAASESLGQKNGIAKAPPIDQTREGVSKDASGVSIVPPPPAAAASTGPAAEKAIRLEEVGLTELESRLTGLGKRYVVVDAWATWCVPCRVKFPKYVELANRTANDRIAFVSLAVDEQDAEKAREFLQISNAAFPNYRLANVATADWRKKLGFDTVPHYLIVDGTGTIAFRTDKFEELETEIQKLLNQ